MLSTSVFIAALSVSAPELPYKEVVETDESNARVVIRSSEMPDLHGGLVTVEQRLQPLGGGRYAIDPMKQSRATQLYHEAYCEDKGMKPSMTVGTLSGDLAVGGFSCYSDVHPDDMPSDEGRGGNQSDQRSVQNLESEHRASDYVIANASSGHARVGQNFFATGRLRMVSSLAGPASYRISVDNYRCKWEGGDYGYDAFWINVDHGVSCIGHRPGFLRAVTEGCMPKVCGRNSGNWSISDR